jgi:hypothetical protein
LGRCAYFPGQCNWLYPDPDRGKHECKTLLPGGTAVYPKYICSRSEIAAEFFQQTLQCAISKQINQSEEVSAIVNGFSQEILPEVISLIGILAVMFWQNITLTLLAIAVIPFTYHCVAVGKQT